MATVPRFFKNQHQHPPHAGRDGFALLHNAGWMGILLLLGVMVYANTLHAPFLYDDINFITLNDPSIHISKIDWPQLKTAALKGKPRLRMLPNISFALNYYFGGSNPFGYHLANLGIHLFSGILLFFFFKTTIMLSSAPERNRCSHNPSNDLSSSATQIAGWAALIWLVHPVQTQAVTYVAQRMASMAALLFLLSLFSYVKGRMAMRRKGKYSLAPVLYFAACLIFGAAAVVSKQNTATLPVFILLYEWFFFQNKRLKINRWWVFILSAFFIFGVIAFFYLGDNPVHRILSSYAKRHFTLGQRLLTESRVVVYCLSLIAFPSPARLNIDYDYPLSRAFLTPSTTLLSITCLAALAGTALYTRKKNRLVSFTILWFLGNLIIESSVIGIEIIYEHRLYLPSMLVSLMSVVLMFRFIKSKPLFTVAVAVLVVGLSIWTHQRNALWQNDIAFWQDCVKKSPNKARPYQNLAYTLQKKGKNKQAIRYYKQSLAINPNRTSTLLNLGTALMTENRYYDAVKYYSRALKRYPRRPEINTALAGALQSVGELENAKYCYQTALRLNPTDNMTQTALKQLIAFMDRYPLPTARIKQMIKQQPQNAALKLKLAMLYEKQKKPDDAIKACGAALETVPPTDKTLVRMITVRLAILTAETGKYDKAIALFKKAIPLAPDDPKLYYNIASIYALKNNKIESINWLKKAIDKGYRDLEKLQHDGNLDNIRNTEYFQKLLRLKAEG